MARATGIGGVFFRSKDPEALRAWYVEHLGLPDDDDDGYVVLKWGSGESGATVWSPFPTDTSYFGESGQQWMLNYRVDDLDAMLGQLRARGVRVADEVQEEPYGRFGWAFDPEGNRFELWEPPQGM
ncbi:MAG: VOC family protein [Thermoleophilia bacterium]|nr:VOC family protein [Thermoleophilia bacterium]MDH3725583.1 VOC family protein [Thermoleophilia bacterium]